MLPCLVLGADLHADLPAASCCSGRRLGRSDPTNLRRASDCCCLQRACVPLGQICLGKGVKEYWHSVRILKPCADFSVKSAQAPRPCTGRPVSRQFGGDPT